MKKLITVILALTLMLLTLTGCNKQILDTTYKFDKAIIQLPDGSIVSGAVESWNDYEGDQLQIKVGGNTYLVHSMNAVLISSHD